MTFSRVLTDIVEADRNRVKVNARDYEVEWNNGVLKQIWDGVSGRMYIHILSPRPSHDVSARGFSRPTWKRSRDHNAEGLKCPFVRPLKQQ